MFHCDSFRQRGSNLFAASHEPSIIERSWEVHMSPFVIAAVCLAGLGALEALVAVVRKVRLCRKAKRDFRQLVEALQESVDR